MVLTQRQAAFYSDDALPPSLFIPNAGRTLTKALKYKYAPAQEFVQNCLRNSQKAIVTKTAEETFQLAHHPMVHR